MTNSAHSQRPTPIGRALSRAQKTQRELSRETGIAQARISRIVAGTVVPKAPELFLLGKATGTGIRELTGSRALSDRVEYAARASDGSGMEIMRETLLSYMDLSDYLHDQAIH